MMRGQRQRVVGIVILFAAVVLCAGGIYYATRSDSKIPAPGSVLAHMWVDTTGGTCAHHSSPVAYVDAEACDSLDAANDKCDSGETVIVKSGTYSPQIVTGSNDRAGPAHCTIKARPGAMVVMDGLASGTPNSDDGSRFLTLDGFVLRRPTDRKEAQAFVGAKSQDVTLKNIDGSSFYVRDTVRTQILGGDWGPCLFSIDQARDACTVSKFDSYNAETNTGAVVDGAYFHDYRNDPTRCLPAPGTSDCHNECLFLRGVTGDGVSGRGITIRNSRFEDCAYFGIFVQPGDQPVEDITIENNWFEPTWDDGPNTCCTFGRVTAILLSENVSNVLIRFNSFHEATFVTSSTGSTLTNVRAIGNIMKGGQCVPGVSYAYNLFNGPACGKNGADIGDRFPYVDSSFLNAGGNYHLSADATTPVDYVTPDRPDYQLTTDYDGDERTPGARDAGADERGG